MSIDRRRKRKEDVRHRAKQPDHIYKYCRVIGCGERTTAGAGSGLNQRLCRRHEDHYERHGSTFKRSYRASEIAPHRKAAMAWVRANENDPAVRMSINAIADLYYTAGPRIEAFRLAGLPPEARALATWASLRDGKVDARDVVAVWLAVAAVIQGDLQAETKQEFKQVQAAKLMHRMAGGAHKRWERSDGRGGVAVTELHKYPHSRGRVLRHIGEQLERAAALVVDQYLDGMLMVKA